VPSNGRVQWVSNQATPLAKRAKPYFRTGLSRCANRTASEERTGDDVVVCNEVTDDLPFACTNIDPINHL
jgi:hypothetical protein